MDRTQSVVYALLVVNVGWGTHDNYLHDRPFDPIMTAPGLAGAAGLGILVCGTWLRWRRRRHARSRGHEPHPDVERGSPDSPSRLTHYVRTLTSCPEGFDVGRGVYAPPGTCRSPAAASDARLVVLADRHPTHTDWGVGTEEAIGLGV